MARLSGNWGAYVGAFVMMCIRLRISVPSNTPRYVFLWEYGEITIFQGIVWFVEMCGLLGIFQILPYLLRFGLLSSSLLRYDEL